MAKESFRLEGLRELQDGLAELPKATGKNTIRRALTRAAQPMVESARSMAPERKGVLRRSITASKVKFNIGDAGRRAYAEAMASGASRKEAAARAHEANAEAGGKDITSGILMWGPTLEAWYAHFQEFGTAKQNPRPFMRPAWEQGKRSAAEGIREILKEEIEKARQRILKKTQRLLAKT